MPRATRTLSRPVNRAEVADSGGEGEVDVELLRLPDLSDIHDPYLHEVWDKGARLLPRRPLLGATRATTQKHERGG